MIVTFRCKHYANITMFGDVALRILKIMGHSGTVPGVIVAQDVPAALERLKNATEHSKTENVSGGPAQGDDKDPGDESVSLANRALPLIELLNTAIKEKSDVMWDEG